MSHKRILIKDSAFLYLFRFFDLFHLINRMASINTTLIYFSSNSMDAIYYNHSAHSFRYEQINSFDCGYSPVRVHYHSNTNSNGLVLSANLLFSEIAFRLVIFLFSSFVPNVRMRKSVENKTFGFRCVCANLIGICVLCCISDKKCPPFFSRFYCRLSDRCRSNTVHHTHINVRLNSTLILHTWNTIQNSNSILRGRHYRRS